MRAAFAGFAVFLLSAPVLAGTGFAAGAPETVKVALLDMSSIMGGWRSASSPAVNQGQAWSGMGPQMMGYGWSSPGQGHGAMGYGVMALRIDHESVRAGEVRFDVTNWSRGMIHELMVIRVDNPEALLPYDYAHERVAEDQVKVLGDTGALQPNETGMLDLQLAAGTYMLICNVPGHYASGMATALTVTP